MKQNAIFRMVQKRGWVRFGILIFLLSGIFLPQAQAEKQVVFTSPDALHLFVSHSPGPTEIHFLHTITSPGGSETTLIDGSGAVTAHAVRVDASDDAFGTWQEHSDQTSTNAAGVVYHTTYDGTFDAGNVVSGTMYFDETIGGDAADSITSGTVRISSGITLTLNEGNYGGGVLYADGGTLDLDGAHLTDSTIIADDSGKITISGTSRLDDMSVSVQPDGTLDCADDLVVNSSDFDFYSDSVDLGNAKGFSSCNFHYYTPPTHTYEPLHRSAGTLYLEKGSEGASLQGTNYNIMLLQGNISFDMEDITLSIGCDVHVTGLKNSSVIIGDNSTWPTWMIPYTIHLDGLTLSYLNITGGKYVDVTDCEIAETYIRDGSPVLSGNGFTGPVNVIYGGTPTLENNVFHSSLTLVSPPHALAGTPTIENNDFMGPSGITYDVGLSTNGPPAPGSIVIGRNYYGSPKGPALGYTNTTHYGFLGDPGAQFGTDDRTSTTQHYEWFSIPAFHTEAVAGVPLKDAPPCFWAAGWAVGQGVLNWIPSIAKPMYKNVPGLVAYDVRASQHTTAHCYLKNLTEGTTLQPIRSPSSFQREVTVAQNSPTVIQLGLTTLLFEVPPPSSHDSVHIQLHVEDSNGDDHMIKDSYLSFTNHPWVRPLRIAVVPFSVHYWLSRLSAPAGSTMKTFVQKTLPAIFPIPHGKLVVDLKPKAIMSTGVGLISNVPGLGALSAKLSKKYVDITTNAYDLVIALAPKGAIRALSAELNDYITSSPPAAGVNYGYGKYFWVSTSRILIVDESTPMAYLHELGHAAGLYRDTEQYDMPVYKASEGMPLQSFSAGALQNTGLGWFPNRTRLANFAPSNASWYSKGTRWIDVMGLPERFVWPDLGTHSAIMEFFNGICSSPANSSAALTTGDAKSTETSSAADSISSSGTQVSGFASGTTVVVGGLSVRIGETVGQQPVPDRAWIFDAAGIEEPTAAMVTSGNWYQYAIMRFLDDSATVLTNQTFDLPSTQLDSGWWSFHSAIPSGCTRMQLLWEKNGETLIKDWAAAGTLGVHLDTSLLSDPLARQENLEWTITASNPATNSQVYSQVSYSLDNGLTWIDWDEPTEDNFLSFNTDFLPVTDTIALRVTVSDGFSMAQDTVTGRRILDRAPTISVSSPRTNDVALEGTDWPLTATAMDVEDGSLPVTWTSSRDGSLTTNTILSPGTHTLTATATDSALNTTSVTLPVRVVTAAADTDLAIDSLGLAGTTHDIQMNWSQTAPGMTLKETNEIECVMRNSGIATTGTLEAVISPPSGTQQVFSSESLAFEPFAFQRIQIPVVPEKYGVYNIEAQITPEGNPDRTPANNQAACEVYTKSPVLMIQVYGRRNELVNIPLSFVSPGFNASTDVNLYNGGNAPLNISSMTLSNHTESTYVTIRIRSYSPALPAVLLPGESVSCVLEYYAQEVEIREATLHIYSDDPLRPHLEVPVYGYAYPWDSTNNLWRDEDNDRLPSFIEERIGTDRYDPDSDHDGIIDGLEDRNGNGIHDPMETLPLNPDTDGDGLLDGVEDRNGNGGMDGDETSPLRADTDADTLSDYGESVTHTDGLNPDSFLGINAIEAQGTNTLIRWSGKRGVHYQVQHSLNMNQWTLAPTGVKDDEQPDRTAARDEVLTYRSPTNSLLKDFMRIRALP